DIALAAASKKGQCHEPWVVAEDRGLISPHGGGEGPVREGHLGPEGRPEGGQSPAWRGRGENPPAVCEGARLGRMRRKFSRRNLHTQGFCLHQKRESCHGTAESWNDDRPAADRAGDHRPPE